MGYISSWKLGYRLQARRTQSLYNQQHLIRSDFRADNPWPSNRRYMPTDYSDRGHLARPYDSIGLKRLPRRLIDVMGSPTGASLPEKQPGGELILSFPLSYLPIRSI